MAYLNPKFQEKIRCPVHTVFELGSRDLKDACELVKQLKAHVYAFECNPDCLALCEQTYAGLDSATASRLTLVPRAVSTTDGPVTFYAFDRAQYDNMGASSMLKIDFAQRDQSDPDYGRPNPQKPVTVEGVRMDSFMARMGLDGVDLVCMDLQGYELEALKSFAQALSTVKYIILETATKSTYTGGACFSDVKAYLEGVGFAFVGHDAEYGELADYLNALQKREDCVAPWISGDVVFSEFNCIFENKALVPRRASKTDFLAELEAVRSQLASAQSALDSIIHKYQNA